MPLVTLVGGSGFIGRYAAQGFARAGWRVRIAVRRPNEALSMRTYGDVGQVEPVQANIRDDASIAAACEGADAVVNLVGILAPSGKQTFDAVQADGAERVAMAAKAAGATRLVQVSAIGADAESRSAYARTKAAGEAAMRAADPHAVILRPSIVFGPEDQFFNRFAGMAKLSPILPVVGAKTRFQPVYVNDVAAAVVEAASRPLSEVGGRTYELGGPGVHSFEELMRMMLKIIRRRRALAKLPFFVAEIQGATLDLLGKLPFFTNTLLTRDQVFLLRKDNVVSPDAPALADLGITPTALEAVLPDYLWRFRPGGQYSRPTEQALDTTSA